jgi:hypothetical protein
MVDYNVYACGCVKEAMENSTVCMVPRVLLSLHIKLNVKENIYVHVYIKI